MTNEIIFFVSAPLYIRDYERFGAEILLNNGFKVKFLDVSPYINSELFHKATKKNIYEGANKKILYNKHDTIEEINKIPKSSFVVILLPHYNYETYHIFHHISKEKIPYAVSVLSCLPTYGNISKKKKFYNKLKKLRPDNFVKIILNKIFHPVNINFMGVSSPDVILLGGRASLSHQLSLLSSNKTKKLWLHSFDYDVYLKDKTDQNQISNKMITFIDAPSPRFKFDALIKGISSPLTEEMYYPALCNFFDTVEYGYGKKVSIASHPKSEHKHHPSYFGFRSTHKDQTISMIRQSKVVVNRNSTSVNFAVLYNKPIIFHTSDEIENSSDRTMSNQIKLMASALNKTPININNLRNISWDKELVVDKKSFDKYKDLYIKKKNTKDVYIWLCFSNWIKQSF